MAKRCWLAAMAMMAGSAHAQHRPITTFDVAGVHLGDSPATATNALGKAGYRVKMTRAASFDQAIAREVSRRRGSTLSSGNDAGVATLVGIGPRLEHLEVAFDQTATGSIVREVTLTVPETTITLAIVKQQLAEKYGPPDAARSIGTELSWCSPEAQKACGALYLAGAPLANEYPILEASLRGNLFLALRRGQIADRGAAHDREAAIEARAPRGRMAF